MASDNVSDNFIEAFGLPPRTPAEQAAEQADRARREAEAAATARLVQQRQEALDTHPHTQILPEPENRPLMEGRILDNLQDYALTKQDYFREEADTDRAYLNLVDTANSHRVDAQGQTPLAQICSFEASDLRDEAIGNLLAAGADPWATDVRGRTALHAADAPAAALLIQAVPEERRAEYIDTPDCNNERALHQAANKGEADTTQLLLDAGADASLVNRKGETAEQVAQGATKNVLIDDRVAKERDVLRQVAGLTDDQEPVQRSRRL